jgi:hypothetical protein
MCKKIGILILTALVLVGGSMQVHAAGDIYTVPYSQPPASDGVFYTNFLCQRSDGSRYVVTVCYGISAPGTVGNYGVAATVTSSKFTMICSSSGGAMRAYAYNSQGVYSFIGSKPEGGTLEYIFLDTVVGFQTYGQPQSLIDNLGSASVPFSVLYASDPQQILLDDILSTLMSIDSSNLGIYGYVVRIYNSAVSIDQKLAAINTLITTELGTIQDYQSKAYIVLLDIQQRIKNLEGYVSSIDNTVKDILDSLNQQQQNETDQANQQGNSSIDQGNAAIPNDSAAVTDGLSSFIQGLSYNGTACSWTMPRVYIPAIAGVIGETTLISEQPIDFAAWLNALPSGIVIVMRVICSVALILFSFKELYNMIEYVLTLRGKGGSDE